MSGGQAALGLDAGPAGETLAVRAAPAARTGAPIPVIRPDAAELEAHECSLAAIDRASGAPALFRADTARGA
jgi:hypothetical protein